MKSVILYGALIASAVTFCLALAVVIIAPVTARKSSPPRCFWLFRIKHTKGPTR